MLRDELAGEIAWARCHPHAYARPCEAIVLGAGNGGRQFLRHHGSTQGVRFLGFVDDDPTKAGSRLEGLEVWPTQRLRGFAGTVVVAVAAWEQAERRLRELRVERWIYSHDFTTHLAPLPDREPQMGQDHFDVEMLLGAWDQIEWLDSVLADKLSRETLRAILRYRLTRRVSCVRPATYREYRHPLVRAEVGNEVIDAGAFDGDTAALFLETMGGDGTVHAFEPSGENLRRLRDRVAREGWQERVVAIEAGVGATDGEAGFMEDAASPVGSRVAVAATMRVKIRALDSYCAERRIAPGMIKMDVEGCERAALRGAERVLRQFGPKLQICLYHRAADLWEIPAWLKDVRPGYRFYLGHHTAVHWSDVVLYAR
ncbi:MAG TPA: FkbM family methyltransferase [Phycisphaerae bacterium]|nr:FkbM family methyltransferase [Phycisphaerae bacterium]